MNFSLSDDSRCEQEILAAVEMLGAYHEGKLEPGTDKKVFRTVRTM